MLSALDLWSYQRVPHPFIFGFFERVGLGEVCGPDPVEGVGHTLDTLHRNAFGVFRPTAS